MTSSKRICSANIKMHWLDGVKISATYWKSIDGWYFWYIKDTSKNVQFCRIGPKMPKWRGVMSYFFGFQFIVFVPLPTPYFTSDFKNLKNFEKKNTKIFDFFPYFMVLGRFWTISKFSKKKVWKFRKKSFFSWPPRGPYGNGVNFFFVQKHLKR